MYDPRAEIEELLDRIANEGGLSDSDAVKIMSRTRQLLEIRKNQNDYPILNLYCNWCFHPTLSGSSTCYKILERITDIFIGDDGSNPMDIPRKISGIISMKELRSQFIALYCSERVPTYLFDYRSNWKGFAGQILKEIIFKTIEFPQGKLLSKNRVASKIYSSLITKAGHRPLLLARKLWLSDKEKGKEGQVYWFVETMPNVRITGRLLFTEIETDFKRK